MGTFALGSQRNAPGQPGPVRGRLDLDPLAPTTSMEAPEPQSATATAAGPDSKPVSMGRPGATSSDRMTAASSVRADIPRSAAAISAGDA
jgi:hypothetical protein